MRLGNVLECSDLGAVIFFFFIRLRAAWFNARDLFFFFTQIFWSIVKLSFSSLPLFCCCESVSSFWCHSFVANLPNLLGSESEQEHSWDMFKIGQTALHLKVDKYSSVDFHCYSKVQELKNSNDRGKEHKRTHVFIYSKLL